jgi:ABC-2 type transport system permease protein
MKKTNIILVNEIITVISRPSFWFATLGIPLLGALIFAVVGLVNKNSSASQAVNSILSGPTGIRPEGYIDQSGLIQTIPATIPPGTLLSFPDEAAARAALADGRIAAFYIVAPDYLKTGQIRYIRPDLNPLATEGDQSGMFQWALQVNLLGGDWFLANLVNGPMKLQEVSLAAADGAGTAGASGSASAAGAAGPDMNNPLAYWLPYAVTLLFYFLIMGSSSLLLSNVSKEKENRVIETLLTSVTPLELLSGKIIGLGVVGLGQTVLWLGTGYVLMNLSGRVISLPSEINLPFSILVWGLVFFVLGYAVYASLMAGLGALAPNLREASQVTMVIMLPLIIPLFFSSSVFMNDPNGPIATAFSLFPLSAPVAMMARLAAGGVPWWQVPLSALLLAGTAVLIVRAVAGMFRAQALLSGQGIQVKTYLKALVGKA